MVIQGTKKIVFFVVLSRFCFSEYQLKIGIELKDPDSLGIKFVHSFEQNEMIEQATYQEKINPEKLWLNIEEKCPSKADLRSNSDNFVIKCGKSITIFKDDKLNIGSTINTCELNPNVIRNTDPKIDKDDYLEIITIDFHSFGDFTVHFVSSIDFGCSDGKLLLNLNIVLEERRKDSNFDPFYLIMCSHLYANQKILEHFQVVSFDRRKKINTKQFILSPRQESDGLAIAPLFYDQFSQDYLYFTSANTAWSRNLAISSENQGVMSHLFRSEVNFSKDVTKISFPIYFAANRFPDFG
jgi:hypothetical protein